MSVNFLDVVWQFITQLLTGVQTIIDFLFNTYDIAGVEVSPIAILGGVGLVALVIWSIVK